MSEEAVFDNEKSFYVASESGINFKYNNSDTNGKGIYIKSGTENDTYPVYYYRGNVTNNNVLFGNFCWKIVRTTSKGGIKLVYNGTPQTDDNGNFSSCNNTGADSQLASTSKFNSNYTSPADVGYMYGTRYVYNKKVLTNENDDVKIIYGNDVEYDTNEKRYILKTTTLSSFANWSDDRLELAKNRHYTCLSNSNTCEKVYYIYYFGSPNEIYYLTLSDGKDIEDAKNEMFSNTNKSTIKTAVDNWYASNMTDYTNYLEDEEWCIDRSIMKGGLKSKDELSGTGKVTTFFGAYYRVNYSKQQPSLKCLNEKDKLSVSKINNSNLMPYPVGLLSAEEIILSGAVDQNNNSYLTTDKYFWTLSPSYFWFGSSHVSYVYFVKQASGLSSFDGTVHVSRGVRPSIVLKQGLEVKSGTDGSFTNPYQIS